jgi:hypothetical protein
MEEPLLVEGGQPARCRQVRFYEEERQVRR